MIHVAFPLGSAHGWGIAGKAISRALAAVTPLRLLTDAFDANLVGDSFEFTELAKLIPPGSSPASGFSGALRTAGPVLQAITGPDLAAYRPQLRGTRNVGYTFFEDDVTVTQNVANAGFYDAIATGSDWNRDVLRDAGYAAAETIVQGVDPRLFNPVMNEKEYFRDQFVIFSGGKLELRKGQDIVLRSFKALQQKRKDVVLVNQWFNQWPLSLDTMKDSKLIKFERRVNDYFPFLNQLFSDNGINSANAVCLPPMPNFAVSRIYKNTDVGLFPNRCEGGTNLVMNEYMACGKPVIAAYNTGQRDVLTDANSVRILQHDPLPIMRGEQVIAHWQEPSLDETIAHLEWAYDHRDDLSQRGHQAGKDMQQMTWQVTAERFLKLLQS